jgi:hypothetical protein
MRREGGIGRAGRRVPDCPPPGDGWVASSAALLPRLLDQPLTHPPLVLAEQHAAKLLEPGGRIVERAEDALPVIDSQCDDGDIPVQGEFEHACGRFVDERCELADEFGSNEEAGEHHRNEATA